MRSLIAMMKISFLLLSIILNAAAAWAQATIKGCVADQRGGALPGVRVVASNSADQRSVVTDSSGCYVLSGIHVGTYTVTADLPGMVTARHHEIAVRPGQTIEDLDFQLCLGALDEIDWVVPGGLADAWEKADFVAEVRVASTRPVQSACPTQDVLHTAAVIEMFKGNMKPGIGHTLTFRQENWSSERTPYVVGQQMILFLVMNKQELSRLAGPYYAFLINADGIAGFHSPVDTEGISPSDFRQKLRALHETAQKDRMNVR